MKSDKYMGDHYASESDNPPLPACTSDKYMEADVTVAVQAKPTPTPTPTATPAPIAANVEPQEPPTGGGGWTGWIIGIAAVAAVLAVALGVRHRHKKRT